MSRPKIVIKTTFPIFEIDDFLLSQKMQDLGNFDFKFIKFSSNWNIKKKYEFEKIGRFLGQIWRISTLFLVFFYFKKSDIASHGFEH